jgi:hypothetical protein
MLSKHGYGRFELRHLRYFVAVADQAAKEELMNGSSRFARHFRRFLRIAERESGAFEYEFFCVFYRRFIAPNFKRSSLVLKYGLLL